MKKRILLYIKHLGIKSADFERRCGLSNGSVAKMGDNTRHSTLDKISIAFPDLNINWLLTGEGNMLTSGIVEESPSEESSRTIRYWSELDATAGGVESFNDYREKFRPISVPDFDDCTDAINVFGDSMSPLYKSGDIIIMKEWNESYIDFGHIYLIITRNGNRMIKKINPGSAPDILLCVSENPAFAPFEIKKDDVLRLYQVKGSISRKAM